MRGRGGENEDWEGRGVDERNGKEVQKIDQKKRRVWEWLRGSDDWNISKRKDWEENGRGRGDEERRRKDREMNIGRV